MFYKTILSFMESRSVSGKDQFPVKGSSPNFTLSINPF